MKTINITLKIEDCHLNGFEAWLREHLQVVDLKVIPDTTKLYENDKHFQKLVKAEQSAKKAKSKYINEHNH